MKIKKEKTNTETYNTFVRKTITVIWILSKKKLKTKSKRAIQFEDYGIMDLLGNECRIPANEATKRIQMNHDKTQSCITILRTPLFYFKHYIHFIQWRISVRVCGVVEYLMIQQKWFLHQLLVYFCFSDV